MNTDLGKLNLTKHFKHLTIIWIVDGFKNMWLAFPLFILVNSWHKHFNMKPDWYFSKLLRVSRLFNNFNFWYIGKNAAKFPLDKVKHSLFFFFIIAISYFLPTEASYCEIIKRGKKSFKKKMVAKPCVASCSLKTDHWWATHRAEKWQASPLMSRCFHKGDICVLILDINNVYS